MSGVTTAVVFGVAAVALIVIYAALWRSVQETETWFFEVMTSRGRQFGSAEIQTMQSMLQERLLNAMAAVMVILLVVLFLVSLVVGWVLAGRALAPLDRLVAVANEIEATDLSRRIGRTGSGDELERVAVTFDAMLDRLDEAFQNQRRFLAQTSHDLRTPLAVIRSNLDVPMSDPDATAEEWRASGELALRASERMTAMIDDLLTAARLEVSTARTVPVDLADVVTDGASDIHAAAAGRSITVEVSPNPAAIDGDRHALDRALANLVDNALRVTPEGGAIRLGSGVVGDCAYVVVADGGPGVDRSLVRGDKRRRSGLGLEIVRRIVASHRGWIDADDADGGGARVVMWFPVSGHGGHLIEDPPSLADHPEL